jgi:hypothetical protein
MHAPKIVSFVARPVHTEHSQSPAKTRAPLAPFLVGHMLLIVGSSHVRARTVHGAARPARTHELPRCHPGAAFGL